jgi:hypothetical protein
MVAVDLKLHRHKYAHPWVQKSECAWPLLVFAIPIINL